MTSAMPLPSAKNLYQHNSNTMTIPRLLIFGILLALSALWSCQGKPDKLPILGERSLSASGDTLYPQVPDFQFVDQDGQLVNNSTFQEKIYVVDFFFIHCPTICPKVTANILRVYDKYKNDPRVGILAHTVDTRNDTVAALQRHAQKIGVRDNKMFHFVTGDRDKIYDIADKYYAVRPSEDKDLPGGFNHDGKIILVDKNRHVRAWADGTDAESVTEFLEKMDILLAEQFPK